MPNTTQARSDDVDRPTCRGVVSNYQINRDGKTAYEKAFGKPCRDEIVEFGEEVHYRINDLDTGSLDARWATGV